VFRGELGRVLTPLPTVVPAGVRKSREALIASANREYPGFDVMQVREWRDPTSPIEVLLGSGPRRRDRIFDPYSGQDLGDRVPREPRSIEWLVDFHENLLAGSRGRAVNGIGAISFAWLCVSGLVSWWRSVGRRRRVARARRDSAGASRRLWYLHATMGVSVFPILLAWAVSGVYLSFPAPFSGLLDALQGGSAVSSRAAAVANQLLAGLVELHFGRFAGNSVKTLWAVAGTVSTLLLVTGLMMWAIRARAASRRTT